MKPAPMPDPIAAEAMRMRTIAHEVADLAEEAISLLEDYSGGDSETAHHLRNTLDAAREEMERLEHERAALVNLERAIRRRRRKGGRR